MITDNLLPFYQQILQNQYKCLALKGCVQVEFSSWKLPRPVENILYHNLWYPRILPFYHWEIYCYLLPCFYCKIVEERDQINRLMIIHAHMWLNKKMKVKKLKGDYYGETIKGFVDNYEDWKSIYKEVCLLEAEKIWWFVTWLMGIDFRISHERPEVFQRCL